MTYRTSTILSAGCLLAAGIIMGCNGSADLGTTSEGVCLDPAGHPAAIVEDRTVYQQDKDDEVQLIELKVDDLKSLADVNNDVPNAVAAAAFKSGSFGAGVTVPNATLETRGRSVRLALQKSFKIKFTDKTQEWRGHHTIDLNKHPYDLTRVRQMLAFELFRSIPNFTSLRTQFVHLMINGQDYGLFTQVEDPNSKFLAAHGLDPLGTVYKANNFAFAPIDDAVAANPDALALVADTKANGNLPKLQAMLRDVNDPALDIDTVIARHFHRDNYLTWLAITVLVGDFDTRSSNFMLYSPAGCDTWYFLPWDYDGALGWNEQPGNPARPRWKSGLSNWWGIPLHQRFFQKPQNVTDLRAMMTQLRGGVLSDNQIAPLLAKYQGVVRPYLSQIPDLWNLPTTPDATTPELVMAQWDAEYLRLGHVIGGFDAEYDAVRERPMPVVMFAQLSSIMGQSFFQWTPSYDLQGAPLSYDFQLSLTKDFSDTPVMAQSGLAGEMMVAPMLPGGTYYWRVITRAASNPAENWQISFNPSQTIVLP